MASQDRGIYSFKEVITFSRLREEEEARIIRREEKMGAIEDQDIAIQRRSINQ